MRLLTRGRISLTGDMGLMGGSMPSLAQSGTLAQRLRDLREGHWPEAGLTQAALAKALSSEERVSPATVSSWENTGSPSFRRAVA